MLEGEEELMANKNRIQDALGEAREDLILNKYNDAMMLMAQITMDVIEHLTDEALIVSKGYEEDLKVLKANGVLSDDTAHNFETLIISGVQAHNGVDIPKEHAEQALQVLTNELDIIFKNEDIPFASENLEEKSKFDANTPKGTIFEYDEGEGEPYPGDFSKDMTVEGSTPVFMQKEDDDDFRNKEKMRAEMLMNNKKVGNKKRKTKLIAIVIPILLVFLIIFSVKAIFFSGKSESRIQETPTIIVETFETETTETEPTEPPAPPEAGYYDVTGDLVSIRESASTESRILARVNKGSKVQVKSFYNNDWALISYEGREAYISRRYIKKDESLVAITEED